MDPAFFAHGVTHDATPAGGAPRGCANNVRAAWKLLQTLADSNDGEACAAAGGGVAFTSIQL
jgi:hypothetical protein